LTGPRCMCRAFPVPPLFVAAGLRRPAFSGRAARTIVAMKGEPQPDTTAAAQPIARPRGAEMRAISFGHHGETGPSDRAAPAEQEVKASNCRGCACPRKCRPRHQLPDPTREHGHIPAGGGAHTGCFAQQWKEGGVERQESVFNKRRPPAGALRRDFETRIGLPAAPVGGLPARNRRAQG